MAIRWVDGLMLFKPISRLCKFLMFNMLFLLPPAGGAQAILEVGTQQKIDVVVNQTLASTGVPSVSLAVVGNGRMVYEQAYGYSNLETRTLARPEMRYCIGSITKQFIATSVLMLAEQGKLKLDDPVSKFVPDLTRGNEVTIRQLLSMTSGYQDFWPQDYVPPRMLKPVTPQQIIDRWAHIPLDFDPGTKWQYSNTNYVIAGLIVERVSGMQLLDFLKKGIFAPLQMNSVTTMHTAKDTPTDPTGYLKYALGPPRPAPKEGKGWMFGAGELAMTASDLARWDIGIIERKLLKKNSYKQFETEVLLKNGVGTRYGLGISVAMEQDHRTLSHGGEVSGFVARNVIYPDDRAAVVVLTNLDASTGAEQIARKIGPYLFPDQDNNMEERLTLARKIFDELQRGRVDRALLTANCNEYFSEQAIHDFASSLEPLGIPEEFTQASHSIRGGMGFRLYRARFKDGKSIQVTMRDLPDGKIEQYQIAASE
jgi:D-alanyl-D-alanine carboxypeptidase